ncbi:MAG: hypothetical protein AAGD07_18610 [Planctomycetota bacterium]
MNSIPIGVGFIAICVAGWHEWAWYRRQRHCIRLVGRIVDEIEDENDITTRWKIEYEHANVERKFVSAYGGSSTMQVGDNAIVVLDLHAGTAEHLTWSNRWVFTVGPMLLGIAFVIAGITMTPQDRQRQSDPTQPRSEVERFQLDHPLATELITDEALAGGGA